MSEIWRDIPGYEGCYEVSDAGRVRSLARKDRKGQLWRERILRARINSDGYLKVVLCKDNLQKGYSVHRLVMLAFVGKSDLEVNHINGDKTDNRLVNLEYATRSENSRHAFRIGLKSNKGESHPSSRLTNEDVIEIRRRAAIGESCGSIAGDFGVGRRAVHQIVSRNNWSHI